MLINFISSDFIFFWITDNKAGKGEGLGIESEKVKTGFTVTGCFVNWDTTKGYVCTAKRQVKYLGTKRKPFTRLPLA